MSFDLPVELWCKIFSSLNLEELCRARAVCRTWWEIINYDHFWKPKLLERRITNDCVVSDTQGDVKTLKNCEWANTCFKYYNTAIRNWNRRSPNVTECPPSTEFVLIHLPYMLRNFHPYNVVELLRLSNGSFAPWAKIPLPKDPEEGLYKPQMTCSDAFAISKNSYTVIFKLRDGSFCFEKVISFVDGNSLTSCSNESKAPGFLRDTYQRRPGGSVSCLAIFKDVVWIYETFLNVLIVWDYLKSEVKLRIDSETLHDVPLYDTPLIHTAESRVYLVLPVEVSIYLPQGQRLWFYKHEMLDNLFESFCSNQFGCGFIEKNFSVQRAIYYNATKVSLVYLEVEFPISVQLDEYCDLAYCLSYRSKSLHISCLSTSSGKRLWESKICSLPHEKFKIAEADSDFFLFLSMKMKVVFKKYIVIHGMGNKENKEFAPGFVNVFSLPLRKTIWSRNFEPAIIVHLSDNFIVTRNPYARGGMKFKFLVYNFLLPNEPPSIVDSLV